MARKKATTVDLGFLRGEDKRTDLSELFASSIASEGEMQQAIMVKIDRPMDNPYQPRVDTNAEGIEALSNVIKSQGFQGALIARRPPHDSDAFQITAGHRSREAAKRAGLQSLPVVVRDLTEEEMITLAITENIQREDL